MAEESRSRLQEELAEAGGTRIGYTGILSMGYEMTWDFMGFDLSNIYEKMVVLWDLMGFTLW